MSIKLHINRLVIDDMGFQPRHLGELKIAIQSELTRQLRNNGIGPGLQSQTKNKPVDGGLITNSNSPSPKNFGRQIGKAIFRGINK